MKHDESVTTWIEQLKLGQMEAADAIWNRYVTRLIQLGRRKMHPRLRTVVDEEDAVLSAFHGFLKAVQEERFVRLNDRHDLWQILVMMTKRRIVAYQRNALAIKRGGGKVRGHSAFLATGSSGEVDGFHELAAEEPTPAVVAEVTDCLRDLLNQLGDSLLMRIALGKLEGWTNRELADELDVSLRAVERKLSLIRRKWSGAGSND